MWVFWWKGWDGRGSLGEFDLIVLEIFNHFCGGQCGLELKSLCLRIILFEIQHHPSSCESNKRIIPLECLNTRMLSCYFSHGKLTGWDKRNVYSQWLDRMHAYKWGMRVKIKYRKTNNIFTFLARNWCLFFLRVKKCLYSIFLAFKHLYTSFISWLNGLKHQTNCSSTLSTKAPPSIFIPRLEHNKWYLYIITLHYRSSFVY